MSATTMLSEREVADMVGVHVATIRRWRKAGLGPAYIPKGRTGRLIRYKMTDVQRWLDGRPARAAKG